MMKGLKIAAIKVGHRYRKDKRTLEIAADANHKTSRRYLN